MRVMFNRLLIRRVFFDPQSFPGNGRLQVYLVCSSLRLCHRDATSANLQCFPPPLYSRCDIALVIVWTVRVSRRLVCDAGQYNERMDFCFTGRDSGGKSMRSIVSRTSLSRTFGVGRIYQQEES